MVISDVVIDKLSRADHPKREMLLERVEGQSISEDKARKASPEPILEYLAQIRNAGVLGRAADEGWCNLVVERIAL